MLIKSKPNFADIVTQFESEIRPNLSYQEHRILNHIQACRTPVMGGHVLDCESCHRTHYQYHSCRDRHCPCCGYQASQQWVEARMEDVLPVTYHHLVFTLPHTINHWVHYHRKLIYRLLFQAVWSTLNQFGRDPKRLDGQLGAMLVLHTWGQNLGRHVHIHCLVPSGALQSNMRWQPAKSTYLFPVRALSRCYRGKMVSLLRAARSQFEGVKDNEFNEVLDQLMAKNWNVYSKPVISKTETVVGYLARYTKRIGLTNARILKVDNDHVWLRCRDKKGEKTSGVIKLEGVELLRRFILHTLPSGFMRVRYYGYLANVHRRKKLKQIRQVLANATKKTATKLTHTTRQLKQSYRPVCTKCQRLLRIVRVLPPKPHWLRVTPLFVP